MGRITSTSDLSGFVMGGILLGSPALDPDTGVNVWDHEDLPDMEVVAPAATDDVDQLIIAIAGGAL